MNRNDEKVSAAIAEQASERFVDSDAGSLSASDSEALAGWLKTSPTHIEEFLGISAIARDLQGLKNDPKYAFDVMLDQARTEEDAVHRLGPVATEASNGEPSRRWQAAAAALAACALLGLGALWWISKPALHGTAANDITALHFKTEHAEQLTRRLPDNSVLHLNADSAITVQYGNAERLVTMTSGEASFEVAHEPDRAFRVLAGPAQVVAIGTNFDVRLEQEATLVTVLEGRVAVGPSNESQPARFVELRANQQLRVTPGAWPAVFVAVDSQRATEWLQRKISFDHETLERVAAEYNRYARKPIEIVSPTLRSLQISGVFSTDDPEEFVAFLRSLKGVRVEVTATQIRVSSG